MKKKMRKTIIQIGCVYAVLFAVLISYLSYFVIVKSESIVIHANNRRMDPIENEVLRGDILSSDGKLIAHTTVNGDATIRQYPQDRMYAHAVGYTQKGKTGIEALANVELLRANYTLESIFRRTFEGERFQGRDIVLTIDHELQTAAQKALGNHKGAVVILESSTGKIKALVSKPDFDPNKVSENWEGLLSDHNNSPLINRAFSGLYPPGSIFKIVMAQGFFDLNGSEADLTYTCTGDIVVNDNKIRCFNNTAHGEENLHNAFRQSCNTYFVYMGGQIGARKLKQTGEQLLFNKPLPMFMEHSKSQLLLSDKTTEDDLPATYIGQGKTLVTPIHMAMMIAAISNEGLLMKPYLLDYSMDKKGHIKTKNLPEYLGQLMSSQSAKRLEEMMVEVVENGTGRPAKVDGMYSGGKTGTAQNETSQDHSWFIGFTGKESPDLSMAIIIENAGKGVSASTVAQKITQTYKNHH